MDASTHDPYLTGEAVPLPLIGRDATVGDFDGFLEEWLGAVDEAQVTKAHALPRGLRAPTGLPLFDIATALLNVMLGRRNGKYTWAVLRQYLDQDAERLALPSANDWLRATAAWLDRRARREAQTINTAVTA